MSFTENKIDFSIHRNEKDPGLRQPIWNSEQDLKVWTALFTSKQRKLLRNCVLYCGFIKKMMSISGHSQNSNWTLFFSDFCVYEKDTAPSFIKIKREVFETARFFLCRARKIFQKKKRGTLKISEAISWRSRICIQEPAVKIHLCVHPKNSEKKIKLASKLTLPWLYGIGWNQVYQHNASISTVKTFLKGKALLYCGFVKF